MKRGKSKNGTVKTPQYEIKRWVYFMRNTKTNAIKIGFSMDIPARISTIQSIAKAPIEFLGCIEGDGELEHELHIRFGGQHIGNEWFTESPELMEYIAANTSPEMPLSSVASQPPPKRYFKNVMIFKGQNKEFFDYLVKAAGLEDENVTSISIKFQYKGKGNE